ncbi:MAG: cell division topological specificity factor MinE [Armatimonadetes bacterium]|nr:cell division topological specificity factor MinE [Armatimonadota bacterium]
MPSLFDRIFGRAEKPAHTAKNRLKLVLMHDRADIPAPMMDQMRKEIIAVLSKYVVIDESQLDVSIERGEGGVALVASIPIVRVNSEE